MEVSAGVSLGDSLQGSGTVFVFADGAMEAGGLLLFMMVHGR